MAKFDPKTPPIFFDSTGKRWLITKVIVSLLFINIALFGILIFSHSSQGQTSALTKIKKQFDKTLNIPTIEAKAGTLASQTADRIKEVDDQGNFYTIIKASEVGNYPSIRDKVAYLDKIICDCYDIGLKDKSLVIKDNSTATSGYDVRTAIDYAQELKPSVVVSKLIRLNNETLSNTGSFIAALTNLPDKNQELIIDIETNQIKVDTNLLELLKQLKSSYNLSLFIGANQSVEEYRELGQVTNNFYVQLFRYSSDKGFDKGYSMQNLRDLIQSKKDTNISINLPTYTSFGSSSSKLNQLVIDNQIKTINFDQNQLPFVELGNSKIFFGNEFYYSNVLNQLKAEITSGQIQSLGFDNLIDIPTQSFALLSDKKSIVNIFQDYSFSDKVIITGEKSGTIYELVSNVTNGKLSLEQDLNSQIKQASIQVIPTQSQVKVSGKSGTKIALSFDGGPNPAWTPKILDKLKELNIKASFFVTGKDAEFHPDLIERIAKEGHLIGNLSYDYLSVNQSSDQDIRNQIMNTNDIIYKASGVKPYYFRTPLNQNPSKFNENDIRTLKIVSSLGMKVAEAPSENLDYNNLPADPKNQISFYDNQKDNTDIANSLAKVILTYQDKSFRFVTLEEIDGLNNKEGVDPQTYLANKTSLPLGIYRYFNSGQLDLTPTRSNLKNIQNIYGFIMVSITVLGVFRLLTLILGLIASFIQNAKRKNEVFTPPVTVIVPSYNEEKVVCDTVQSLVDSNYPELEILVVDDGSTDKSYELLCKTFKNTLNVTIITKENGGKASALNYGIKKAKHDFIVCMDADTLFDKDAIMLMMKPLADPEVGGVAGNVQIGNDYFVLKAEDKSLKFFKDFNWLTTFQRIEYISGQNFDKEAYSSANSVMVVPGAIGAWRKEAILKVGGYKTDTLAEDTNLTLDIIRAGYKIKYEKDALCFTEAPETLNQLWKQRFRWQFGTMQVLFKNFSVVFNPKYGMIGFYALPQTIFNLLNLFISPISNISLIVLGIKSILGYWYPSLRLSETDIETLKIIFLISFFFFAVDVFITIFAIWRDRSKNKYALIWFLPFVNSIFKSFIFVVTTAALIKVLKGEVVGWGHLIRTGKVKAQKTNLS